MPERFVFPAPLLVHDSGTPYVPIPAEVDEALDGARIVRGTVEGVAFRRAVRGRGNGHPHVVFGKTAVADMELVVGAIVLVEMEPADPDAVHLPDELAAALAGQPEAAAWFAALTPGRQRSLGMQVGRAKLAATRERRARDLIEKIHAGTVRLPGL